MTDTEALEVHAEAEALLYETEAGRETGPFWQRFVLDIFGAMLRQIPRDRAREMLVLGADRARKE